MSIPERFEWATAIIKAHDHDHILEIGCGAGILLQQIAATVTQGHVHAIDKSAAMIALAAKRNANLIREKTITVEQNDFAESALPKHLYNKVVMFNVNFIWKKSDDEFRKLKAILSSNGELYIFHQAPRDLPLTAAGPVFKNLEDHGFIITRTELKKMTPACSWVIIARKGH